MVLSSFLLLKDIDKAISFPIVSDGEESKLSGEIDRKNLTVLLLLLNNLPILKQRTEKIK